MIDELTVSMLDYFAAHASDADVESYRHLILKVSTVGTDANGCKRIVENCEPTGWRTAARFMHAASMVTMADRYRVNPPRRALGET